MWVLLSDCFFSIVHKDCARDELLVRARRPGDIKKLWPEAAVKRSKGAGSDYLYRAVVKRADAKAAIAAELQAITYSNFKDSVDDDRLHDAYLHIWTELARLQPTAPFTGRKR
jgi:hypothetical protein